MKCPRCGGRNLTKYYRMEGGRRLLITHDGDGWKEASPSQVNEFEEKHKEIINNHSVLGEVYLAFCSSCNHIFDIDSVEEEVAG